MRQTVAALPRAARPRRAGRSRRCGRRAPQSGAGPLHPPAAIPTRPMPRSAGRPSAARERTRERRALSARRQHPRRRGCSTGCARRKARPIRPTPSTSPPRLSRLGHLLRRRRDPARARRRPSSASRARSSPSSPRGRPPPDEFARAHQPGGQRHRAAAGDQRLLGAGAGGLVAASRVTSRMSRTYLADYRALTPEDVRRGGRRPRSPTRATGRCWFFPLEGRPARERMADAIAQFRSPSPPPGSRRRRRGWKPFRLQRPALLRGQEPRLLDPAVGGLGRLFLPAHAVRHRQRFRLEPTSSTPPC